MSQDAKKAAESMADAMNNYKGPRDIGDYLGTYPQAYTQELRQGFTDGQRYIADGTGAVLVNPKQIYWIRKRRIRREMLDSIMVIQNANYLHESRHRHAMKRLRAPSGRFLTKEETAEIRKREGL